MDVLQKIISCKKYLPYDVKLRSGCECCWDDFVDLYFPISLPLSLEFFRFFEKESLQIEGRALTPSHSPQFSLCVPSRGATPSL